MLMTETEAVALAEARALAPHSLLEQEMAVFECDHLEVTAELARRWKFPEVRVAGLAAAADPLATRPFSRLGAALRLASGMSDAGESGLPEVATLQEVQPELVSRLQLDIDGLARHLLPWATLTSGVDQML